MRVMETATGKILEVNASYGARLCEQGKAVPCPAASKPDRQDAGKAGAKAGKSHGAD